jgi:hypothetical protein
MVMDDVVITDDEELIDMPAEVKGNMAGTTKKPKT